MSPIKAFGKPETGTVIKRVGIASATVDAGGSIYKGVRIARSVDWTDLRVGDLVDLEWAGDQAYVVAILNFDQAPSILPEPGAEIIIDAIDDYLEEDADDDEEEEEEDDVTSGRQYATFVVAANDSTDDGKDLADYVCSGSNDHVTINTALSQATTSGYMRVLLLEGTYDCAGTIDQMLSNTTLEGQGAATVLESGTSYMIKVVSASNIQIKNLKIDCSGTSYIPIWLDTVTTGLIKNLTCVGGTASGDFFIYGDDCDGIVITHCRVYSGGIGIDFYSSSNVVMSNNILVGLNGNGGIGARFSNGSGCVMSGNIIKDFRLGTHATLSTGPAMAKITFRANTVIGVDYGMGTPSYGPGNTIYVGNTITTTDTYGVGLLIGSDGSAVVGNVVYDNGDYGMHLENYMDGSAVVGNIVNSSGYRGIRVEGDTTASQLVVGNICALSAREGIYITSGNNGVKMNMCIANSQETDNAYSNIAMTASSNDSVQFNMCRDGGGAKQPKYGIDLLASSVVACLLANNDLRDSGKTADIHDSGTGTIQRDNDV